MRILRRKNRYGIDFPVVFLDVDFFERLNHPCRVVPLCCLAYCLHAIIAMCIA